MQKYMAKPPWSWRNNDNPWCLESTFTVANLGFPGSYEWKKIYLVVLSNISWFQIDNLKWCNAFNILLCYAILSKKMHKIWNNANTPDLFKKKKEILSYKPDWQVAAQWYLCGSYAGSILYLSTPVLLSRVLCCLYGYFIFSYYKNFFHVL